MQHPDCEHGANEDANTYEQSSGTVWDRGNLVNRLRQLLRHKADINPRVYDDELARDS